MLTNVDFKSYRNSIIVFTLYIPLIKVKSNDRNSIKLLIESNQKNRNVTQIVFK